MSRLEAALAYIGTEGDGNGVKISFGAIGTGAAAKYEPSFEDGKLTADVTMDPQKMNRDEDWGIIAAHEGDHIGRDGRNFRL
ncbi:MAG: hypothetical protein JXR49_17230 [Acidobacteria bacterium]|nr:hypothetical protein [Acidobacteriota bacterium]